MTTSAPTLIYDPRAGFRSWYITEIYTGPGSTGQYVPHVNDMVVDWTRGVFQVTAVDLTSVPPTYIPTLELVDLSLLASEQIGLSQQLSTYQPSVLELAFLNIDVMPYTISIDDRYRIYGTEASYLKLYRGVDLSIENGVVISQTYNGSGALISENVILELIDPSNTAIKRPPVFNTTTALFDGETVTAVIYTVTGGVTGQHTFLIKNTNAIRGLGSDTVYISDIVLVTTLLDTVALDTVNVPANIPISGGDFQARLLYSDGTDTLISVGTPKCKLLGIDNFNTSIAGVTSQVVLVYYPDPNEPAVNITNPSIRSISHTYTIRTINNVLDYSFKIYVVPKYNATTQQFSNDYYLTNLAYNILIKLAPNQISVTLQGGGNINYSINSGAQALVLAVVMSSVIPYGYSGYTFVQVVTVNYGSSTTTPWYLDYLNNNTLLYGSQVYFEYSTQGQQPLSIISGAQSISEWLARLYLPLHPTFNQNIYLAAPTPTHFQLTYHGIQSPVLLITDYWNILIQNYFGINFVNYDTVLVTWLVPTADITVYSILGVSPVIVRNTLT